ncbi:hypothetical protein P3F83_07780 [Mycobacteroides immunogenum]|uniref:hypothetical protein n=1 Tax=Mycobacteroides immunogenum TaxID=83262 RepID=UPI0025B76DEF|nr:hypothetical protein [Mycobacteroides immunogenum]WJR35260.1 hypothetical protein P3F83_07780 [Mycobacteroides immunogenum]
MCQSRAQGGKRCAAHSRSDEVKLQHRRVQAALSAAVEAETAAAAAALLTDDVDSARRAGVQWSLEPAAVDAQRAVEVAQQARRHAEELALVAGLTDTKNNPSYRDDLLAALPPTVEVDGQSVPAADVASELAEAQRQAGLSAGEAKRHNMFDRTEDADECAAQAELWRNRAGHLASALRVAMADGVVIAADAITAPVRAVGNTLREVAEETVDALHEGMTETFDSYAGAVGISAAAGGGSTPSVGTSQGSDGAPDGGQDHDDDSRPLTRAERAIERETREAQEINAAVAARGDGGDTERSSVPAAVDADDDPLTGDEAVDSDASPMEDSRVSAGSAEGAESGSAPESRPVSEMSDDELIAHLAQVNAQARGHGTSQVSGHGELAGRGTAPTAHGHRAVSVSEGSAPSPSAPATAHTPSAPSPHTAPPPRMEGSGNVRDQSTAAQGGGWLAALSDADLLSLISNLRRKTTA